MIPTEDRIVAFRSMWLLIRLLIESRQAFPACLLNQDAVIRMALKEDDVILIKKKEVPDRYPLYGAERDRTAHLLNAIQSL